MKNTNTKYKKLVQELKDIPRYGNLRGLMLTKCNQEWYDFCLEETLRHSSHPEAHSNIFPTLLSGA